MELADLSEAVATVFAEVLGRPVGPDDDFFDLGGDSLQALRIVNRVRQMSRGAVRLTDLARHATPRALSYLLDERNATAVTPPGER